MRDDRTQTTGFIMADQTRTISAKARKAIHVEELPEDILLKVSSLIKRILDND
ncbi:MAG: type II toxin-antitoxin system PemK/MazF family toxin [Oscillospiraceae bacterium]|nr:type II toxin-antitoxin system PemK/MazF family toxin [Oscillospiraceae bacterium]